MTEPPFGMPGAAAFMSAPTDAQKAVAAELARRQAAVGSPEQLRATRAAQLKVLIDRHAWLLANAADPVLRALIDAHGPHGKEWPDCLECPERDGWAGSSDPESWPCGVWMFISDRMETP